MINMEPTERGESLNCPSIYGAVPCLVHPKLGTKMIVIVTATLVLGGLLLMRMLDLKDNELDV